MNMKINATGCLWGAITLMAACTGSRPLDPRVSPGGAVLATGEPAGGESAPIAGRVDLPPQQPRR